MTTTSLRSLSFVLACLVALAGGAAFASENVPLAVSITGASYPREHTGTVVRGPSHTGRATLYRQGDGIHCTYQYLEGTQPLRGYWRGRFEGGQVRLTEFQVAYRLGDRWLRLDSTVGDDGGSPATIDPRQSITKRWPFPDRPAPVEERIVFEATAGDPQNASTSWSAAEVRVRGVGSRISYRIRVQPESAAGNYYVELRGIPAGARSAYRGSLGRGIRDDGGLYLGRSDGSFVYYGGSSVAAIRDGATTGTLAGTIRIVSEGNDYTFTLRARSSIDPDRWDSAGILVLPHAYVDVEVTTSPAGHENNVQLKVTGVPAGVRGAEGGSSGSEPHVASITGEATCWSASTPSPARRGRSSWSLPGSR